MSPCIFAFTSLPLLLSICFFWFLHLSASSFFGWLYLHFSSNCLFPSDSWSLQAWMVDYCILPVFCVCSSHSSLLARLVPFFVVFVTARNTFHVRLWHPAMTAPSVSWRLWRVLVSIFYPVLHVANHVLSGTEPPVHFFQACHVDGREFLPKKRCNCSTFWFNHLNLSTFSQMPGSSLGWAKMANYY